MISVVTVTWNPDAAGLEQLLALVGRAGAEADEVVVVDNGSEPPLHLPGDHGGKVRVVRAATNRGYAAGVNTGLSAATGDTLIVLNPDTGPETGAIRAFAGAVVRNPDALLGAIVLDRAGRVDAACARRTPRRSDILRDGFFVPRRPRRLPARAASDDPDALEVEVVSGAAMALSRTALQQLGPMDEEYFLYHEDVEWCDRARERGLRVALVPGARFAHAQGSTTRRDERWPFAARVLADFQFFVEHRGLPAESIRWRWRLRQQFRAFLYGLDVRFGLLGRRPGSPARVAIYSELANALASFRWSTTSDGQNAHPSRILGGPPEGGSR